MKYKIVNGRCVALQSFGSVREGDVGGFVEEGCLSQTGNCWVFDDARVSGSARISGNAQVCQEARVSGSARIVNNAVVYGNAAVYGNADVYGYVSDWAEVFGNSVVSGVVYGRAWVFGDAVVSGRVNSDAMVNHDVSGTAIVITGLGPWTITVTDRFIRIGCVCKTKKWWGCVTDTKINTLDPRALEFWKKSKEVILSLC